MHLEKAAQEETADVRAVANLAALCALALKKFQDGVMDALHHRRVFERSQTPIEDQIVDLRHRLVITDLPRYAGDKLHARVDRLQVVVTSPSEGVLTAMQAVLAPAEGTKPALENNKLTIIIVATSAETQNLYALLHR